MELGSFAVFLCFLAVLEESFCSCRFPHFRFSLSLSSLIHSMPFHFVVVGASTLHNNVVAWVREKANVVIFSDFFRLRRPSAWLCDEISNTSHKSRTAAALLNNKVTKKSPHQSRSNGKVLCSPIFTSCFSSLAHAQDLKWVERSCDD